VFFDVDETLVPGTSSGQHLAGLLGHAAVVREAEAAYAAGTLTNREVSVLDAATAHGLAAPAAAAILTTAAAAPVDPSRRLAGRPVTAGPPAVAGGTAAAWPVSR
jgi:hypothetical protein